MRFLDIIDFRIKDCTRIISQDINCCFKDSETKHTRFYDVGRQLPCFFFIELKDASKHVFMTKVHQRTDEVKFKFMIHLRLADIGLNKIENRLRKFFIKTLDKFIVVDDSTKLLTNFD